MPLSRKLENPYTGSTAPTNLYIGRVWHEITFDGLFKGSWIWNGTYWLSLAEYSFNSSGSTATYSAALSTVDFPVNPDANIFLAKIIINARFSNFTSPTQLFLWSVRRINSNGVSTQLVQVQSNNPAQASAAGIWAVFTGNINQLTNVAATDTKTLQVIESRSGTLQKQSNFSLLYRKARI